MSDEIDTLSLLRAVQYALNKIPNSRIAGCPHGFNTSYQLAAAVDRKIRWFDELHRTMAIMAAEDEKNEGTVQ